jgi:hypothetical protein
MRNLFLLSALIAVGCEFQGIMGSGTLVTKDLPLQSFERIDAGSVFHVDVTQGETYSVSVTADDNLWEYTDVHIENNTLHLALKGGSFGNTHVSAKIVLPRLTALDVSGASSATLRGIKDPNDDLKVQVSGASKVDGDVSARKLVLDVSGASNAGFKGHADTLAIEASGASHAELRDLAAGEVHVRASGASDAKINASGTLDFDVSGASHLSYAGQPVLHSAQTSGASSVESMK